MESTILSNILNSKWFPLVLGLLFFIISNGRWATPVAAWITFVFLLRFVRDHKALPGLILLFLSFCFSSALMLYGIIPPDLGVLTYILFTYYAIIWFFPFLIDKIFNQKRSSFISTLIFPAAAVSAEYINNLLYGSWASFAYTQYDDLPLIQIASIFGIWGISFLVFWIASVLNWCVEHQFLWNKIRTGLSVYMFFLLITLAYGGFRLAVSPSNSEAVLIGSLTTTQEINELAEKRNNLSFSSSEEMAANDRVGLSVILDTIHDKVFKRTEHLIVEDMKLVLWAEAMIPVLAEVEGSFIKKGQQLAQNKNVYLLMAYFLIPENDPYRLGENKSVLIGPDGVELWEYLKAHPVPGSSDIAGDRVLPVIDTPFGKVSNAICYDMDFTALIHQAGKKGIDIMLVPAWDWKAIDPLHTRMAVFRAIENGFSMVRQTGNGLSIAVDHQGRTLGSMDQFTSEHQVLIAQIPKKGVRTIYSIIGDVFAWVCLLFICVIISWVGVNRIKGSN